MDDSDYILCILGKDYNKIVDLEIRRALDLYDSHEILFFVKNNKECKNNWKTLLQFMYVDNKSSVKYTEYLDIRDFEIKFTDRLMKLIMPLHKKHKVEFLR